MRGDFFEYPLVPIIVTGIVIYVIGLPIITVHWMSRVSDFIVSILWLLFSFIYLFFTARFVYKRFDSRWTRYKAISAFFNITISVSHIIAIIGMSIWLLDGSAAKNQVFSNVIDEQNRYNIFFSYFLTTSSAFLYQNGYLAVQEVPGSFFAGLWSQFSGYISLLSTIFLFLVVSRPIRLN